MAGYQANKQKAKSTISWCAIFFLHWCFFTLFISWRFFKWWWFFTLIMWYRIDKLLPPFKILNTSCGGTAACSCIYYISRSHAQSWRSWRRPSRRIGFATSITWFVVLQWISGVGRWWHDSTLVTWSRHQCCWGRWPCLWLPLRRAWRLVTRRCTRSFFLDSKCERIWCLHSHPAKFELSLSLQNYVHCACTQLVMSIAAVPKKALGKDNHEKLCQKWCQIYLVEKKSWLIWAKLNLVMLE